MKSALLVVAIAALGACSKSAPPPVDYGTAGTKIAFDLEADLALSANWYQQPWPSDLRLDGDGHPDYSGFPDIPDLPMIESFRSSAQQTHGFSVVPTAYFLFAAPIASKPLSDITAGGDQSVFLIDVDANSPERGKFFPVTATTPPADNYVPPNLLAVGPRPGIVLTAKRTYAFVVLRQWKDAAGNLLGVPSDLDKLRQGITPSTARGAAALAVYKPLFDTLKTANVDGAQVAGAAVFTTGDAVAEDAALYDAVLAKYSVTIDGLALDAPNSAGNDRACRLKANVTFPQFQTGAPPFNTGGLFQFGTDGLPTMQGTQVAPMVLLLPRTQMPAAGFPLLQYFHGSGGLSTDVVDMGPTLAQSNPPMPGGVATPNQGPGWVHAESGLASFGAALPVSPERLPGAGETAYLNLQNPVAMRDTFRQGVIESRLLLRAVLALQLDPALVANCTGGALPALPAGKTAFTFDADHVVAQGQSMGGMYTNLVSAVEPKIKLAVPTGAGGYWTYFILQTQLYTGLPALLAALLETGQPLTQLHPVLSMLQAGWEPNDPYVAMPRVARRPLPGHPARPIYEPVGKDDQYFPTQLYDATALDYGHQQAGEIDWPTMQPKLSLSGLDGLLSFPISQNRTSSNGSSYTGVVEQYLGDGIELPHSIYRQLPQVKYQYRCFVSSWLKTGVATLPKPDAQEAPCP